MGQDAIAEDGQFNFTGFTIITEPNSTFHLELTVNLRSEATLDQFFVNTLVWVHVRPCLPGEEFSHDETCTICPRGTYSLVQPYDVTYC